MRTVFGWMSPHVHDGGRLKHILDNGHKTKMHTYIQVCGTMGAYAVWCAAMQGEGRLPEAQAVAIICLLNACGEIWNHSILS